MDTEIEQLETISEEQIDTNMQTTSDAPSDELNDIKVKLYRFSDKLSYEYERLCQKRRELRQKLRVFLRTANTQNTIPRAFRPLLFMNDRVKSIPEHSRWILIIMYLSLIRYQAGNMEHELNPVNHSDARQALLSLGEAFQKLSAAIVSETVIMTIYPQIFLLVVALEPVYQIFVFTALISGILQYVPYLVSNASGVAVTFGSFKLPLFWFSTSVALPLSLIVNYLIFCGIFYGNANRPGPTVRELDVNVEAFIDLEEGQENE